TDVIVDSKGRIWFADPYNTTPPYGPPAYPFLHHASVLRLERDVFGAWSMARVTMDTRNPRALALSADEKTLYVAEGDAERAGPRELRAYPVREDGGVASCKVLKKFGASERGIEGICVDADGNIIACGGSKQGGDGPMVYVFSAAGAVVESHPAPDIPM